jgi:signal transduction histidine kinase
MMPFRKSLLRVGRRWSLLLLLLSAGATIAAGIQTYRTVRSQTRVMESVRRGYAEFAAWSFEQHLSETLLDAAREPLSPVNMLHTGAQIPHPSDLVHYLQWDQNCLCHRARRGPQPAALFGFKLGSDTVAIAVNWYKPSTNGWLGDPDFPVQTQPRPAASTFGNKYKWINDTLTAILRAGFVPRDGFAWVVANNPRDSGSVVAYTIMPTVWGDTLVYGTQYDSAAFNSILNRVFDERTLLPATFTSYASNRDLIAVQVSDGNGHVLFNSMPNIPWAYDVSHVMDRQAGGMHVRAEIRQRNADKLIVGGSPTSRLPFLAVLLILSAALSLVALAQIMRENDLARAREGFVSSISHELRTPVAQIRLYLETLRLGRVDDDATRDWSLSNIDRETQRLSNLVDNVLRFSNTRSRIIPAPPQRVDVIAETRAVVEEFRPLAASRQVTIDFHSTGSAGDAYAWIPSDALRHILLNLFDNAVKYGPPGQTVHVAVQSMARGTRITVSDEGQGIPETERDAVWEPFSRGDNPASRASGGTGIGLTIVRDLVRANGGTIRIDSSASGGAAFIVELPAHISRERST